MKSETLSLKNTINKLEFLKKTVIIQWNIRRKKIYTRLQVNKPDPRNAKEDYQSFIKKKITKSVK